MPQAVQQVLDGLFEIAVSTDYRWMVGRYAELRRDAGGVAGAHPQFEDAIEAGLRDTGSILRLAEATFWGDVEAPEYWRARRVLCILEHEIGRARLEEAVEQDAGPPAAPGAAKRGLERFMPVLESALGAHVVHAALSKYPGAVSVPERPAHAQELKRVRRLLAALEETAGTACST